MSSVFGFEKSGIAFGATPVENQFILEHLPAANGDYVKVYIYGLLQCYHPEEGFDLDKFAATLMMDKEDVKKAFRHWERRGLVSRTSDEPPCWVYNNVSQRVFSASTLTVDPAYENFAEALYAMFGSNRTLEGKEIMMAYEWIEELSLPPEVVLLLIQHKINTSGKHFSFNSAQKLATQLSTEKATTLEAAEQFLARDQANLDTCRQILRKFGKYRQPSAVEIATYSKWVTQWGFTEKDVLVAVEETKNGDPNFGYLDGILKGIMERRDSIPGSIHSVQELLSFEKDRAAPLQALISHMHIRATVNEATLALYNDMTALYPASVIQLAADQISGSSGASLDRVLEMLQAWHDKGLQDEAAVRAYISTFRNRNGLVKKIKEIWGVDSRVSEKERQLLGRWLEKDGLSVEFVFHCAAYAADADRPMAYLSKMIDDMLAEGKTTPEAVDASRAAYRAAHPLRQAGAAPTPRTKVVTEQQYHQRPDGLQEGQVDWLAKFLKEVAEVAE